MAKNATPKAWSLSVGAGGLRYSNPAGSPSVAWNIPTTPYDLGTLLNGGTLALSAFVTASGGGTPSYSVVSGDAGLTVNSTTGLLTVGAGVAAGSRSVTVSVSNGGANPSSRTFTMTVAAAPPAGTALFADDFNYTLVRVAPSTDKRNTLLARGYTFYKDENYSSGSNGYIYTVESVPGTAALPGTGPKALCLESNGGTEGQTDYYLQLGDGADAASEAEASFPSDVWFQFWYYADPNRNAPSGKWLYALPAYPGTRTSYPGTSTEMPWLLTLGTRTFEPGGVALDSPFAGAHTFTMEGYRADRTDWSNDNQWKLGPNLVTGNARWLERGKWYLHKMHFDTSGSTGRWEWWMREYGVMTWTKMAEYIGGVTPNFSWNTQASERNGFRNIRIPTTNSNDSTQYVRDFTIAANEADLPTYGSY